MDDDEVQILVALAVLLGKAAGNGLLVQRVEDRAAGQLRHTGNARLIGQFINDDGVNDVAGHAQGITDLAGEDTAQVGGVLALDTGLQVSQQGIADGIGAAGDGFEQTAAAHDDVEGLGIAVLFFQKVQNDLLSEVLLVDDAGILGDFLGGVAQRFFKQQGLILEHTDLGGGGAGIDDQGFDGHCERLLFTFFGFPQGGSCRPQAADEGQPYCDCPPDGCRKPAPHPAFGHLPSTR